MARFVLEFFPFQLAMCARLNAAVLEHNVKWNHFKPTLYVGVPKAKHFSI